MVTHTIGLAGCRNIFKYGGGMQDKNNWWKQDVLILAGRMRDLKLMVGCGI